MVREKLRILPTTMGVQLVSSRAQHFYLHISRVYIGHSTDNKLRFNELTDHKAQQSECRGFLQYQWGMAELTYINLSRYYVRCLKLSILSSYPSTPQPLLKTKDLKRNCKQQSHVPGTKTQKSCNVFRNRYSNSKHGLQTTN